MVFGFVKCGPNEAIVVSGCCSSKPVVVPGGQIFVWGSVEKVQKLSLSLMTILVESHNVYTSLGVPLSVTGVAQVKIPGNNQEMLLLACEHFMGKSEDEIKNIALMTLEGHQRVIMSTMTVDEIMRDRKKFSQQVFQIASTDLVHMGISVISYTIKDIRDDEGYLESLGLVRIAEVKRDARVGEAEARSDAEIKTALAEEQRMESRLMNDTKILEAQCHYETKKYEFEAEVATKTADAEMAFELEVAKLKQIIKEEQMQIQVIERREQIIVQEEEIKRKRLELEARIRRPADAEKFKLIKLAEAQKNKVFLEAEANAAAILMRGEAEAFAINAKATAEANQMSDKADAWKEYREAATVDMLLEALPKLVAEVTSPLGNTKSIKMVSSGNAEIGAAKLTEEILQIVKQIPDLTRRMTGVDITKTTTVQSPIKGKSK